MASNDIYLSPQVPIVAHSVTSNNNSRNEINSSFVHCQSDTVRAGNLLGILRPLWMKVCESEQRISWMTKMIGKKLVVRNLDAFAKAVGDGLRSDEYKVKEKEREILMGIMNLKLKDEKKNIIKLKRDRELKRMEVLKEVGRNRKSDTIFKKLHKEVISRKSFLKKKYREKLNHLENQRLKEIEERRRERKVPLELDPFKGCIIFDKGKWDELKVAEAEGIVIGDVQIDNDELALLRMNSKCVFVMSVFHGTCGVTY